MKHKRWLFAAATSVAVVAGMVVASPAMAETADTAGSYYGHQLSSAEISAGDEAVAKVADLRTAITTQNGSLHFDASRALALGADPSTVQQVAVGVVAGGGSVSGVAVDAASIARTANQLAAVRAASRANCAGQTNYSTQWFGHQLKLNSCDANRVIAAMSAGAGVAGLAAIITSETGVGGIAGGVIAGVLAIGAGALGWCAANGTGVIIDLSWAGVPWCAAQ